MGSRNKGQHTRSRHCAISLLSLFSAYAFWSGAAFADTAPEQLEQAKKEGKVVWYCAVNAVTANNLAREFETRYPPVKVEVFRASSEQQLTRLIAEYANRKYIPDVVELNIQMLNMVKEKGILDRYIAPQSQALPGNLKDPQAYWASWYLSLYSVAYNSKMVPPHEVPRTYEDLLDPKWKGKMMMDATKPQWFIAQLKRLGRERGLDYMRKLANQKIIPQTGSLTLPLQLVAAGEAAMMIQGNPARIDEMKKKGASIGWAPISPVIASVCGMGITTKPNHPVAARLFVDFVLSPDGQEIVGKSGNIPSRPGTRYPLAAEIQKLELLPTQPVPADEYEQLFKLFRMTFKFK